MRVYSPFGMNILAVVGEGRKRSLGQAAAASEMGSDCGNFGGGYGVEGGEMFEVRGEQEIG